MKHKLNPIEKFKPMWEGAKSVENKFPSVGFKIRMYVVGELNKLRQTNPNLFGNNETQELTNMILELKDKKSSLSPQDTECSLLTYQTFLQDFFNNLDYEDRHLEVTFKTSTKFRIMASFIDVLNMYNMGINDEMLKCQKYCKYKAVDIFKALKAGKVPKRGGPKEDIIDNNIDNINNMGDNDIDNNMNNIYNNNIYNNNNNNNNNNDNNDIYNDPFGYNNNNNNNNNNIQTSFPSNVSYPTKSQLFSDPFNNNNNINNNNNNIYNNTNNNITNDDKYQNLKIPTNTQNKPIQQQNKTNNTQTKSPLIYNLNIPKYIPGNGDKKVLKYPNTPLNTLIFNGKYALQCTIPVIYHSVDYFMLVENVRINNDYALKELKRGKAKNVLNIIKDSLEFLSYIHK